MEVVELVGIPRLELGRPFGHSHLKAARLPIPPYPRTRTMVPMEGLEPPRSYDQQHLKLPRLPIPPHGHHRPNSFVRLVRPRGIEPPPCLQDSHLKAARLPVTPRPHTEHRPDRELVRVRGLEPPPRFRDQHLKLARLPFHHTRISTRSGIPSMLKARDPTDVHSASWCGRSVSNRHARGQQILSPPRLPVPPRPHRDAPRTSPSSDGARLGI
jgi:hypothetical protein